METKNFFQFISIIFVALLLLPAVEANWGTPSTGGAQAYGATQSAWGTISSGAAQAAGAQVAGPAVASQTLQNSGGTQIPPIPGQVVPRPGTQQTQTQIDITSEPILNAFLDELYTYQMEVTDNGAPLFFVLTRGAPSGWLSIDPQTGLLTGTPTLLSETGPTDIFVTVTDGRSFDTQQFTILVGARNVPPQIVSTAPTTATAGVEYQYQVIAGDLDNDPLTYSLDLFPQGMTISTTGLVRWTPTAAQANTVHAVTIVVTDDNGARTTEQASITVAPLTDSPVELITSFNVLQRATVGEEYTLSLKARDLDRDTVQFRLLNSQTNQIPKGMTVTSTETTPGIFVGTIRWTPLPSQVGKHKILLDISSTNAAGVTSRVTPQVAYLLIVESDLPDDPDGPPMIRVTSTPVTTALIDTVYQYQITAEAPGNAPLTYSLVQGPAWLSVGANGLLSGSPQAADFGVETIKVGITDGTLSTVHEFQLEVRLANGPAWVGLVDKQIPQNSQDGTVILANVASHCIDPTSDDVRISATTDSTKFTLNFVNNGQDLAIFDLDPFFSGRANIFLDCNDVVGSFELEIVSLTRLFRQPAPVDEDTTRTSIKVESVLIPDAYNVRAGDMLPVFISMKNDGNRRLENVVVTVVEQFEGIRASSSPKDYRVGKTINTDLFVPIPHDMQPGIYYLRISVDGQPDGRGNSVHTTLHREIEVI